MKNKILTFLLSFVIAFGLWLYVVTVVSPESEATFHNIPVILDGEDVLDERNLMIISDTKLEVDLKLSGNRMDLNKLSASNITILADLSQITQAGEHNVKYAVSYLGNIEVLEQEPQHITVVVAERSRKEIPVWLDWTGSVPEGYVADTQNAVLDNTTVVVTGPKDAIDQIDHARITVDLTGKTTNIVETIAHTLCDADDQPIADVSMVTTSISEIRTTVKINMIKDIPLKIQVQNGGGITSEMVTITPSLDMVTLSGSESMLLHLNEIVLGTIDLAELDDDTTLTFPIVLPEGITNVTGVTEVSVHVDLPEMGTRTFTVTNFRTENVPPDKHVVIKSNWLGVKVRGPLELLNEMSADDIMAVVDCQNVSLPDSGIITLEITIEIDGVDGVGAVGEYMVSVYVATIISGDTEA